MINNSIPNKKIKKTHLNAFFKFSSKKDFLHVDRWHVNVFWFKSTVFDYLLDFCNCYFGSFAHSRIKVTGRFSIKTHSWHEWRGVVELDSTVTECTAVIKSTIVPEHQVSGLVGFPCFDQCVIPCDGFFHNVISAIKVPAFSWRALLNHLSTGSVADRRTT